MTQNPRDEGLNDWAVFLGFALGLLVGGLAALLGAPRSEKVTRQRLKWLNRSAPDKLESAAPVDPLADSIATGKAAARRRLEELGLDK